MTGNERVKAALEHKESDRILFDLGGIMCSGINVKALAVLKKYLGMKSPAMVKDRITQVAETGEDMIDFLKVDVKSVSPRVPEKSKLKDTGHLDGSHFVEDERGMQWRMPHGDYYYDFYKNLLADVAPMLIKMKGNIKKKLLVSGIFFASITVFGFVTVFGFALLSIQSRAILMLIKKHYILNKVTY